MDAAKIRLSAEEASLINRSDWILTKNNILVKVKKLLENLQWQQVELFSSRIENGIMQSHHPKISKGENYLGLPYLVLDYPRIFQKQDVLAIRTMFWWGNFFSVTLHVAGKYKEASTKSLMQHFELLQQSGFYYCINADPWQYHFEQDNYVPIKEIQQSEFFRLVNETTFTKISAKIPLNKWDDAELMLLNFYRQLMIAIGQ